MRSELPPLNALRFFEAAARHLSFKQAADELGLTPSAVSYEIKRLEEFLATPLFHRLNRALVLTEDGMRYLADVRPALQRLAAATLRVRPQPPRAGVLSVSVLPSFGTRCLVPNLASFRARLPGIDLRIAAGYERAVPGRGGIDCCIRYGEGGWAGVAAERLAPEAVFPVCAPALLGSAQARLTPADLVRLPLLHDVGEVAWEEWLTSFGVEPPPPSGTIFTESAMLLQAACDGHGVALARSVLVRADLRAGRLVRPVQEALPVRNAYWLVCPQGPMTPLLERFRDWLLEEIFS